MDNFSLTIQESRAAQQDYIDLEPTCAGVCEVLTRGMDRRQGDQLSQSAFEAIEQLTTLVETEHVVWSADWVSNCRTVNEINKRIAKRGKRHAISRFLRPNKDKEMIVTWRLNLNRIICTLNARPMISCDRSRNADFRPPD